MFCYVGCVGIDFIINVDVIANIIAVTITPIDCIVVFDIHKIA